MECISSPKYVILSQLLKLQNIANQRRCTNNSVQIQGANSHCAEGNVVKKFKAIAYLPYTMSIRKHGTIDIPPDMCQDPKKTRDPGSPGSRIGVLHDIGSYVFICSWDLGSRNGNIAVGS